jgi:hypothetical protein
MTIDTGKLRKQVILSADRPDMLADCLSSQGYCTVSFSAAEIVSPYLSKHPDMFMCKMGAKDDAPVISYQDDAKNMYPGFRPLSAEYPAGIAYNAACTGSFLIHNLKYTAPHIIEYAEKAGMNMVNVRQGYAKCSTVIVDDRSIITYDRGMAKACTAAGMDVLTISPGHIVLPGYDTGFIGGTSGRAGDTIYFNGDLSSHPDSKDIIAFITERGLSVRFFEEWPLTDIGSVITACKASPL